jgi:hypothetical protein
MKNRIPLIFLTGMVLINLLSNSCKKDTQGTIESLFTGGKWQLANLTRTIIIGDSTHIDTLNTTCDTTQLFTFNADKTCNYTNYACTHQPASAGIWELSPDHLYLESNIVCKDDTSAAGSLKPFTNAHILNLGQYSLVLETGDLQNYSTTQRRTIMRYGFIRQKASAK